MGGWAVRIRRRLRALAHRDVLEHELDAEMQQHVDLEAEDIVRTRGVAPAEARRLALVAFGGVSRYKEEHRDARGVRWVEAPLRDARFAIRSLLHAPGFASATILCLGLGTGATAAVFAAVNALLFRPLPVARPSNLVVIATTSSGMGLPGDNSYLNYLDIRHANAAFEDATAWTTGAFSVRLGERTDIRLIQAVSDNYWGLLGVRPALGRFFSPQEVLAHAPLVVISERFWRRSFNAAPDVLGRAIPVNGVPLTIVGVAPRSFVGAQSMIVADAWAPVTLWGEFDPADTGVLNRRLGGGFKILARLRDGTTLANAQSALGVLATQLQRQFPAEDEGKSFVVERELRARPDIAVADVTPRAAAVFMSMATLVLLVACANVTSLMLARATERRPEFALRAAIGAGRGRIVQQALIESLVIAAAGGIVGTALAYGVAHWLSALRFSGFPIEFDVSLDARVLTLAAAGVVIAAIVSGVGPAIKSSDPRHGQTLTGDTGRASSGVSTQRFRSGLVAAQIAITFMLLVAAGLLLRSVQRARMLDLGFRQDHEYIAAFDVSFQRYDSARGKLFYRHLLAQVAQLPGVRAAALASTLPLGTSHSDVDVYADLPTLVQEKGHTHIEVIGVSPGYFDALGIPMIQGRDFSGRDDSSAPPVMVVNAAAAARLWPGTDPVGRRVRLSATGSEVEVVGMARTTTSVFLGELPHPIVYVPFAQRYRSAMYLHLLTEGDPQQIAPPLHTLVASLDANLTPFSEETMAQHLDQGIAFTPIRLAMTLAVAIGLLGLTQAVIGLYGVVAYSVAQRGREIGIRMAMGATSADILGRVIREGMALAAVGLAVGLALSLDASGVLRTLLIGVSARDPMTFGALAVLLAVVTLAACAIPASRAVRVPPAAAIRSDG